jgi:glycosyltransferase involved in cell wall biosynthesis
VTAYCRPRFNKKNEYQGVKLKNSRTIYTKHLETAFYAVGSMMDAAFGEYDIVHIHALASSTLAWIPKYLGKKKVIVTVHGLDWQRSKWGVLPRSILKVAESLAVKHSHRCICVSRSLEGYFSMRYSGRLFHYIPNGCDPIHNTLLPAPDGLESKGYNLFMGRLTPEKGVHHLIKAYRQVDSLMPLIIAGPHPSADSYLIELKKLAEGDPRIHFVGAVSGDYKEQLLSHAYLFVLPSEIEGLPIALLEAASRGVCPVVSSIPTATEVLGERALTAGFTFGSGDSEQLRIALEVAIQTPELGLSLGAAAQNHVRYNFCWDRIATQTFGLYQQVLRDE